MNKIRSEHLARAAYIYIRQSTPDQVQNNLESQRRQYGLSERARQLGWQEVVVIDDDLGRSGSGIKRPGFDKLLSALCQGGVGAIFSIEASRLARNGRDWHTLLEFCRLVDALLIDEDGVYDPREPNDRLLLGMKGTLSEMELSTFRQRSQAALDEKASRGELFTAVAVGYLRTGRDRIDRDPDLRVRQAIEIVFRKFREFHSARQVLLWLRQERIELPVSQYGNDGWCICWKLPVYHTILRFLTNPIYAGAYAYGRTKSITQIKEGRKHIVRGHPVSQPEWGILLNDHHEGYISWAEYQANQTLIGDNANMKGAMVRGAVKRGSALLSGLLLCGHCGRRLHVTYSGLGAGCVRYSCRGGNINHGESVCISFGGLRPDRQVCAEVLRRLQPLGIQASLEALKHSRTQDDERLQHKRLALEQATYEASRARRQYEAVDPANRLVAAELERRWNAALETQANLTRELEELQQTRPVSLSQDQQEELLSLGDDLPRLWGHPNASAETKKRILRAVLNEIVVKVDNGHIQMVLHWKGSDHTELTFIKNRSGQHRYQSDRELIDLVNELARVLSDAHMAGLLNRLGKRTAHGHAWTRNRVCVLRNDHNIPVYRDGERQERGELTLEECAHKLGVDTMTVARMIKRQQLSARQACKGAPWVIRETDLESQSVRLAIRSGPPTANEEQLSIEFQ